MRKIYFVIFCVLALTTVYRLFVGLEKQTVEVWDEKTNISVVTETIARKEFPILYLNQKPFFEKPPLWYFINSGIATIFGISPISIRLTSSISGLFIICISVLVASRWWGITATIATWVVLLTTNQLFITNAGGYFATHTLRSADLDALQLFFLLIAFISAVEFRRSRFMPIILGVSSALAILTKGPLGILPIILLTGLELFQKRIKRRELINAYLVLSLVVLPWYIFMTVVFGYEFIQANIGYHIAERILIPLEGHEASPWFYLEILTSKKMFVFNFLLVPALLWVILKKKYKDQRIMFLVLMVAFCFIVPSLAQTKLTWYILPIYPFAAMLIGAFIEDVVKEFVAVGSKANFSTDS